VTELSFLVDLLLNHKLSKATKDAIAERIKVVESQQVMRQTVVPQPTFQTSPIPKPTQLPAHIANQAPSMQALMLKHPDLMRPQDSTLPELSGTEQGAVVAALNPSPIPIESVAQTAATQAALAERQKSIALGISGKREAGANGPRKW
jgi:hypothetical protein